MYAARAGFNDGARFINPNFSSVMPNPWRRKRSFKFIVSLNAILRVESVTNHVVNSTVRNPVVSPAVNNLDVSSVVKNRVTRSIVKKLVVSSLVRNLVLSSIVNSSQS